jgi:hypothetical protein
VTQAKPAMREGTGGISEAFQSGDNRQAGATSFAFAGQGAEGRSAPPRHSLRMSREEHLGRVTIDRGPSIPGLNTAPSSQGDVAWFLSWSLPTGIENEEILRGPVLCVKRNIYN